MSIKTYLILFYITFKYTDVSLFIMKTYYDTIPSVKMTDVKNNDEITLIFVYKGDGVDYYTFSKNMNNEWGMRHAFVRRNGEIIDANEVIVKPTPSKNDKWVLEQINVILHRLWESTLLADLLLRVEIKFDNEDAKHFIYTGNKSIYKGKYINDPKKKLLRISTKKPIKLESKRMKHHSKVNKSNSLTKSYKKMTGDIGALGKNFNKLI